MSHQEFSDGTLPDYFLNLWRKKFMTEEEIKEEIKEERKQLEKLYLNNYEKNENSYSKENYPKLKNKKEMK